MQLYIIRHCQSENNALWRRTGSEIGRSSDPGLTDIGLQQAQILAEFLAAASANGPDGTPDSTGVDRFDFTHLYCSLMQRSVQTGSPIAAVLGLPLVAHGDIHERGGIYLRDYEAEVNRGLPGPNRNYFQEHHPYLTLPDSLGEEGWWDRAYEEREQALDRARKFFNWLEKTHGSTEDRVAIISHGGFIQSLYSVLLGTDLNFSDGQSSREIWIKSNNGSISRLDFWDHSIRLAYLNRMEFYPPHLVT